MKKWIKFELAIVLFAILISTLEACKEVITEQKEEALILEPTPPPKRQELTAEFKKYWYSGNAEITSYKLDQARYGELRKGTSVLIFVTEPFLEKKQVKADGKNADNIPVLKLNSTKNYFTGIYPYSIMTSSFYPVYDNSHAIKVSFSAQEWCGHVYAQLNNKENFEVTSHSYFETEADQNFSVKKVPLENEIWNKIRINPNNLPVGELEMIPSLEFVRLRHKELKAYKAIATLEVQSNNISTYTIVYPELERNIEIYFSTYFPYTIEGWSETYSSGFGPNSKPLTTTAVKNKLIITPYWQQNKNSDLFLRESLGI